MRDEMVGEGVYRKTCVKEWSFNLEDSLTSSYLDESVAVRSRRHCHLVLQHIFRPWSYRLGDFECC